MGDFQGVGLMGMFDFHFDSELVRQLERLENFDEIAPRMLEEAIPILEKHVKREVAKHKDTGDLLNSIKPTTVDKNAYGWFICVRPTGYAKQTSWRYVNSKKGRTAGRTYRLRNMEKLVYMEYGTSQQSATPVLTKALNDARSEVESKMQEIFNEVVDGK